MKHPNTLFSFISDQTIKAEQDIAHLNKKYFELKTDKNQQDYIMYHLPKLKYPVIQLKNLSFNIIPGSSHLTFYSLTDNNNPYLGDWHYSATLCDQNQQYLLHVYFDNHINITAKKTSVKNLNQTVGYQNSYEAMQAIFHAKEQHIATLQHQYNNWINQSEQLSTNLENNLSSYQQALHSTLEILATLCDYTHEKTYQDTKTLLQDILSNTVKTLPPDPNRNNDTHRMTYSEITPNKHNTQETETTIGSAIAQHPPLDNIAKIINQCQKDQIICSKFSDYLLVEQVDHIVTWLNHIHDARMEIGNNKQYPFVQQKISTMLQKANQQATLLLEKTAIGKQFSLAKKLMGCLPLSYHRLITVALRTWDQPLLQWLLSRNLNLLQQITILTGGQLLTPLLHCFNAFTMLTTEIEKNPEKTSNKNKIIACFDTLLQYGRITIPDLLCCMPGTSLPMVHFLLVDHRYDSLQKVLFKLPHLHNSILYQRLIDIIKESRIQDHERYIKLYQLCGNNLKQHSPNKRYTTHAILEKIGNNIDQTVLSEYKRRFLRILLQHDKEGLLFDAYDQLSSSLAKYTSFIEQHKQLKKPATSTLLDIINSPKENEKNNIYLKETGQLSDEELLFFIYVQVTASAAYYNELINIDNKLINIQYTKNNKQKNTQDVSKLTILKWIIALSPADWQHWDILLTTPCLWETQQRGKNSTEPSNKMLYQYYNQLSPTFTKHTISDTTPTHITNISNSICQLKSKYANNQNILKNLTKLENNFVQYYLQVNQNYFTSENISACLNNKTTDQQEQDMLQHIVQMYSIFNKHMSTNNALNIQANPDHIGNVHTMAPKPS